MNYFVCQEWQNTYGNHAGMVHLCNEIKKNNPSGNFVYSVPDISLYQIKGKKILQYIIYYFITIRLILKLKKGDKVFLMEYMLPAYNQMIIAKGIKFFGIKSRVFGLVHLIPEDLNKKIGSVKNFQKWNKPVDGILTLGSSLSFFLQSKGIESRKIITLFHYVDHKYYYPKNERSTNNSRLSVIVLGNMKRDFNTLINIIKNVEDLDFHVCLGNNVEIYNTFLYANLKNTKLYKYISEDDLRELMTNCDISLNVMHDTIGSNVITISMALGLALIVSNVGSIHDYCSTENALFCDNENDFINYLNLLKFSPQKLQSLKRNSLEFSKKLSISNFFEEINYL